MNDLGFSHVSSARASQNGSFKFFRATRHGPTSDKGGNSGNPSQLLNHFHFRNLKNKLISGSLQGSFGEKGPA
jgi:hypothetical protein